MTRIQFYIIATEDSTEQFAYALRLAMQNLAMGKHLHIHTESAKDTRTLLEQIADKLTCGDERLTIDHKGTPGPVREVLLNLSSEVPYFFSSFEATLEIICDGSATKAMGRERYRYYQTRGYPLRHHEVQPQLAL